MTSLFNLKLFKTNSCSFNNYESQNHNQVTAKSNRWMTEWQYQSLKSLVICLTIIKIINEFHYWVNKDYQKISNRFFTFKLES